MSKNHEYYEAIFRTFEFAGRDEMTYGEFEPPSSRWPGSRRPLKRAENILLKEKMRNGVFFVRGRR
jgi:hypothetical protein